MSNKKSETFQHFKGWIGSESMKNEGWLQVWRSAALEAEEKGCELVVFEIKKGHPHDFELIEKVEKLIQLTPPF